MALRDEHVRQIALRTIGEPGERLGGNGAGAPCPGPRKELPVVVACFDDFAHCRREFAAPLNPCSRIANVDDDLIRVALKHGSDIDLEPFRVGILVNSIGAEQGQQATQDQRLATLRGRQALA